MVLLNLSCFSVVVIVFLGKLGNSREKNMIEEVTEKLEKLENFFGLNIFRSVQLNVLIQ